MQTSFGPCLNNFILTFDSPGSPEVLEFWSKIADKTGGGSGKKYIHGWLTAFCFWNAKGGWLYGPVDRKKPENEGCSLGRMAYHSVGTQEIPDAYASVPVKVVDELSSIHSTRMVAGLVGIQVTSSGDWITATWTSRVWAKRLAWIRCSQFLGGGCMSSRRRPRLRRGELPKTPNSHTGRRSTRQIPWTLFTAPEIVHVGLREHEAKSGGVTYRLTKLSMAAFLRRKTLGPGETEGFAKALIAEDDTVLGFTELGSGVGDLLPVVQLAMKLGVNYKEIANLVITHPTLSERLVALLSAVPAKG